MQCKCGPDLKESTHTVTTEAGKLKWLDKAPESDIYIQQWHCEHCERVRYQVWNEDVCIKIFG